MCSSYSVWLGSFRLPPGSSAWTRVWGKMAACERKIVDRTDTFNDTRCRNPWKWEWVEFQWTPQRGVAPAPHRGLSGPWTPAYLRLFFSLPILCSEQYITQDSKPSTLLTELFQPPNRRMNILFWWLVCHAVWKERGRVVENMEPALFVFWILQSSSKTFVSHLQSSRNRNLPGFRCLLLHKRDYVLITWLSVSWNSVVV